ncbi:MAG: META domain-containing protein [Ginsengibacter sp.]
MKMKYAVISLTMFTSFILTSCGSSRLNIITNKSANTNITIINVPFQDTHWKLIDLVGKPVNTSKNHKEMYIVFGSENNRAEGSGGCNAFVTSYQLTSDSSVFLGELASTKMYCAGIEIENAFFMVLSKTDHFQIHDDTLILSKGRELNLAKFVGEK